MRFLEDLIRPRRRTSHRCNYLTPRPVAAAIFDDLNLVSTVGLVPVMALAQRCDIADLVNEHLSVPTDKGANAELKVGSVAAGMVAGVDSITDMALLRRGAMKTSSTAPTHLRRLVGSCASSPSGTSANSTPWRHGLSAGSPSTPGSSPGVTEAVVGVMIDIDDSIIEVHGPSKQGCVRGLSSLITTLTTNTTAPVIVGRD